MHPTPPQQSLIRDGLGLSLNGVFWPRPYFPTRTERASLIQGHLPPWAIPTGSTAGWIWTGMGSPTPFALLRPRSPALSPIVRERWKAREYRGAAHQLVTLGSLTLVDPEITIQEILLRGENSDACATQLLFLGCNPEHSPVWRLRLSSARREITEGILERLRELRERYPDITR
jgi:hypothetical protein